MLSRRTLLSGLLACIPLLGMKKASEKCHYVCFTSPEKQYDFNYDKSLSRRTISFKDSNEDFKVIDVKLNTNDLSMSNILIQINEKCEYWVYNVHYSDCMWSYR